MLPCTTNFTECNESTENAIGVAFGIAFALRFSLLSSRSLVVATTDPPEKVLLGDFANLVYLIQKELDQEGKFTGARITNTISINTGNDGSYSGTYTITFSDNTTESYQLSNQYAGSPPYWSLYLSTTQVYGFDKTITGRKIVVQNASETITYNLTGLNDIIPIGKSRTIAFAQNLDYIKSHLSSNLYTVPPATDYSLGIPGMGLVYFGVRYYDPEIGVWTSTDPDEQYWNSYSYCGGDPINYIDPNGEDAFGGMLIGMAAGAITGAAIAEVTGKEWWQGALIGGAIGASYGSAIGFGATGQFYSGWPQTLNGWELMKASGQIVNTLPLINEAFKAAEIIEGDKPSILQSWAHDELQKHISNKEDRYIREYMVMADEKNVNGNVYRKSTFVRGTSESVKRPWWDLSSHQVYEHTHNPTITPDPTERTALGPSEKDFVHASIEKYRPFGNPKSRFSLYDMTFNKWIGYDAERVMGYKVWSLQ